MKKFAIIGFCFLLSAGTFMHAATAQLSPAADDPVFGKPAQVAPLQADAAQSAAADDGPDEVGAAPPVGQPGFPAFASDVDIATIYHKLTGQPPVFEQWARLSPQCQQEKTQTGRIACQENKQEELRQKYQLQTLTEAVAVPFVPAVFSAYSKENSGYIIKNFTDETYMPFSYAGRNYALIPQGLMDRQFLPISGPAQKDVEAALRASQRKAVVLLYIQPSYADPKAQPVELDGKPYTLISGKVINIAVYKCHKTRPCVLLWEEGTRESRDAQREDLMNLKR